MQVFFITIHTILVDFIWSKPDLVNIQYLPSLNDMTRLNDLLPFPLLILFTKNSSAEIPRENFKYIWIHLAFQFCCLKWFNNAQKT